jgi:hypothetical protein
MYKYTGNKKVFRGGKAVEADRLHLLPDVAIKDLLKKKVIKTIKKDDSK